ncbi:hypothetical protein EDB87DRAFT_621546 [Lactarius vividus]|nr:hypothetical protein EDB87DRAFT_621546 [Lactarius vividus]
MHKCVRKLRPPLLGHIIHHWPPASYFFFSILFLSPSPPLHGLHQPWRAPQMSYFKGKKIMWGRPAIYPNKRRASSHTSTVLDTILLAIKGISMESPQQRKMHSDPRKTTAISTAKKIKACCKTTANQFIARALASTCARSRRLSIYRLCSVRARFERIGTFCIHKPCSICGTSNHRHAQKWR